jgi:hypothetical protein
VCALGLDMETFANLGSISKLNFLWRSTSSLMHAEILWSDCVFCDSFLFVDFYDGVDAANVGCLDKNQLRLIKGRPTRLYMPSTVEHFCNGY